MQGTLSYFGGSVVDHNDAREENSSRVTSTSIPKNFRISPFVVGFHFLAIKRSEVSVMAVVGPQDRQERLVQQKEADLPKTCDKRSDVGSNSPQAFGIGCLHSVPVPVAAQRTASRHGSGPSLLPLVPHRAHF
jgi:hypothetical protein